MSLLYIDSMGDHYTVAQVTSKWTSALFAQRVTGLHGYGLRGGLTKGLVFGSTTALIEMHVNASSLGAILFSLADASVTSQLIGRFLADGSILVTRFTGASEILGQSVPDVIRIDRWYHLGIRVKVHASAGELEVRLNGGAVIGPLTGLNTTGVAFSGALRSFTIGGNDVSITMDDLVVMDDVDDTLNDPRLPGGGGFDKFIGPVEIVVKRPNGAGLLAEWVPTPTVANELNVDDIEPDDDTTYNSADATAVGDSDLLLMENLGLDEDVVAVQSLVLARKTEEGIAAVAKLVHDSGTTTVGTTVYQPSTYSYMHAPEPTLPDGSLWTKARWDAIQYGYRRIV
jgi:hypothetical protein